MCGGVGSAPASQCCIIRFIFILNFRFAALRGITYGSLRRMLLVNSTHTFIVFFFYRKIPICVNYGDWVWGVGGGVNVFMTTKRIYKLSIFGVL